MAYLTYFLLNLGNNFPLDRINIPKMQISVHFFNFKLPTKNSLMNFQFIFNKNTHKQNLCKKYYKNIQKKVIFVINLHK